MQQRLIFSLFLGLLSSASFAVTPSAPASTAATQTVPAVQPASAAQTQTTVPTTPVQNPTTATTTTARPLAAPLPTPTMTSTTLKNEKDKISYAIGMDMGTNLKAQNIEVNPDMLARGLKDVTSHSQILLSQQEASGILTTLQKQLIAKRESDFKTQSEQNKRVGDAFLQANKTKPGVVSLPSGLQYKITIQGKGPQPTDTDNVTVHYSGHLINGQEFDSSYRRAKPAQFPVAEVIPGWSEALKLMKVGSTWEIYVPPALAYGERGLPGGPIGPNQTLVFTINLMSIDKKKA
jgi:FKBP-type peptidyl-prolyl cis-trans isomerase FklB